MASKWAMNADGRYVATVQGTQVEVYRDFIYGWSFTLDDGGRTTYQGLATRTAAQDAAERLVRSINLAARERDEKWLTTYDVYTR